MRQVILSIFLVLITVSVHGRVTVEYVVSSPGLEFGVTEYDFGMVKEDGKKVSYDFVVKNTGDSPLVITRIITSCKCVGTSYTKRPIPPGGEGVVSVTYDPKKQQGVFYKALQIFSNAPEGMNMVIIKGEVIPSSH